MYLKSASNNILLLMYNPISLLLVFTSTRSENQLIWFWYQILTHSITLNAMKQFGQIDQRDEGGKESNLVFSMGKKRKTSLK